VGLEAQFDAAKLDPKVNTWNEIYDFNKKEDLGAVHFTVMEQGDYPEKYWQVDIPNDEDGTSYTGSIENPVLLPDGRAFNAASSASSTSAPAPAQKKEVVKAATPVKKEQSTDPAFYVLDGSIGDTLYRKPGDLNGKDFRIENCIDCEIYILDHTSQIQIDDCTDCKIFLGPVAGSAFFRDCKNCTIEVACKQFRSRDCEECTIGIYCNTKPIIETSTNMTFRCWMGAYVGLEAQFDAAKLDPKVNTWSLIHDFNKKEDLGAVHFTVMEQGDYPKEYWQVDIPKDEDGTSYDGIAENPVLLPDDRAFQPQ